MNLNTIYVIDIETNNLLSNMLTYKEFPYRLRDDARLWCIVIRNVGTDEVYRHMPANGIVDVENTRKFLQDTLHDCTAIIAHNGIKFDFIVLKLFGVLDYTVGYLNQVDTLFGKKVKIVDTLVLSRIFNPDRYLGHSLDSWGERVGFAKTDFRGLCIEKGYIDPKSVRGSEFAKFCPEMVDYCEQDTLVNKYTFLDLIGEWSSYPKWNNPIKQENKLADLAIKRESMGFWFDKDLAVKLLDDLTIKMKTISDAINPILPPKKMNKGELQKFTAPKTQLKQDGSLSSYMEKFIVRIGAELVSDDAGHQFLYEGKLFPIPCEVPVKTHTVATIDDLDHVKSYLIHLGWNPSEWRERDLTKDTKKQSLSYEKRVQVLDRWYKETLEGKYTLARLEVLDINVNNLYNTLCEKLGSDFPVRVPTSPCVRVGVEKNLCPNLESLGEKVAFAKDFALYLTYKHRKSCIAGGDIEEMDFDEEAPNTGYLSVYRSEDGRIPTPAIEIGAATFRYKHISVANVPRVTSIYGKEMRSLFGCGDGFVQFGFDYASLENRVQAGYIKKYPGGEELGVSLTAEKPNDVHTVNSKKMGVSRSDAKSLGYAILYGASPNKISKMLKVSKEAGVKIVNDFWEAMLPLKQFKEDSLASWENNDKKYVEAIDGRKLSVRSPHSIINALFQSAGVICAKYATIFLTQRLEELGYNTDPFKAKPDVMSVIEYHDENQVISSPKLFKFETFNSEEEAKEFVDKWEGDQLSAISHGKKWFVCLPNDISKSVTLATEKTQDLLNLHFELGYEWIVGKNWADCH
jgi:hypothetical protein